MKILYWVIAVIIVVFAAFIKMKLHYDKRKTQNDFISQSTIADLEKQIDALRENERSETQNLRKQLEEASKELSDVSDLLYKKHERDFIAQRYTYSDDLFALPDSTVAQKLDDARALCEVLINNGSAVEPIDSKTELPKGAEALLLSAFNGCADSLIDSISSRTNDAKVVNQLNLIFFLTNERGKNAVGAVITKRYLDAKMDVLRYTLAFDRYTRLLREQDKNRRNEEKEQTRQLQELRQKEQEIERNEATYERELAKTRAQLSGSITDQEKLDLENRIKDLEAELASARDAKHALTAAQQGRKGYVYVISNIGSFGEGIYKIGMTRRLEPMDRVRELNVASTPFPFDVHAFIACDDAPDLEAELHRLYKDKKLNLTTSLNEREFYRIDLDNLREVIEKKGLKANWKMEASAEEYYESEQLRHAMIAPSTNDSANFRSLPPLSTDRDLEKSENQDLEAKVDLSEKSVSPAENRADSRSEYSKHDIMQILDTVGIGYVDKTGVGGCFWMESGESADSLMRTITIDGKKPIYAKSSKALSGKPGWFI